MGTTVTRYLKTAGELLQKSGPYLLIELILPGGTLIALLLFLYRRGDLTSISTVVARARIALDTVVGRLRLVIFTLLPDEIATLARSESGGERDGLEPLAMAPSQLARG